MNILGIESSCDETSASVVRDGRSISSLVIASQTDIHAQHHGVVPELASRAHVEQIGPVVEAALKEADCSWDDIDAIAASNRPGLSGSLAVGLSFAKGSALALSKPFVAVDHIMAHAWAAQLVEDIPYPYLVLLVSGGHTLLAEIHAPTDLEVIGATIDDACGEAFDKVSAYLGTGYPGGPAIDRLATTGNAEAYAFPMPNLKGRTGRYDFSYSGLKTAVVHQRERFRRTSATDAPETVEDIAAAFQKTAIDQLLDRLERALDERPNPAIAIGGGVASNSELRRRIDACAHRRGTRAIIPPPRLCVDNGAMVAGLAWSVLEVQGPSPLDTGVSARVPAFRGRFENHRRGT